MRDVADNARMAELGKRLGFDDEAIRVVDLAQDLDGNQLAGVQVASAIDRAHATAARFIDEDEAVGQDTADFTRRGCTHDRYEQCRIDVRASDLRTRRRDARSLRTS